MAEVNPFNLPFRTVLVGNTDEHRAYVQGFADEALAKLDAAARNTRAADLGIVARYEVVAKP